MTQSISRTLRKQLVIFKQFDEQSQSWQDIARSYAQIKALNMSSVQFEGQDFGEVISRNLYLFRIAYDGTITKNMRIFVEGDNSREFEILRLINIHHRARNMDIIALEIEGGVS